MEHHLLCIIMNNHINVVITCINPNIKRHNIECRLVMMYMDFNIRHRHHSHIQCI